MFNISKQSFRWWIRRLDTAAQISGGFGRIGAVLPMPLDLPYQLEYLGDPWWIAAHSPYGERDTGLPSGVLGPLNSWYSRELTSMGERAAYHYFRYALLNLQHCGVPSEHLDKSAAKNDKTYLLTLSSLPLGTLYPVQPIRRRGGEAAPPVENTSTT